MVQTLPYNRASPQSIVLSNLSADGVDPNLEFQNPQHMKMGSISILVEVG